MSVNSYLNDLAQRAIVRDNEKNKIQVSVRAIKERLVPAIIDDFGDYKIPNKQGWYQTQILDWITTNPNDLDDALVNNQTLR